VGESWVSLAVHHSGSVKTARAGTRELAGTLLVEANESMRVAATQARDEDGFDNRRAIAESR
jgi:hypothetical protein